MSANRNPDGSPAPDRAWVEHLDPEDLSFLRRFVLASGSLKETAEIYGISYPTVRLRLDRLIQKIRVVESAEIRDEFERALRAAHADGKVDVETMKRLLTMHRRTREEDR